MVTGTGRAKARGWQAGIYGGWSGDGAFVEGYAGYGWLDYDIRRTAVIDDIGAETDGTALIAGGQAGYLFDLGGMRLGPVIGLRYAKVELDGFTETGDPVLTLNVEDQETDSLIGSAGLELRGDLEVGGMTVQPYAQVALERQFAGDGRTVRYALTAAPTIVNQWVLPDRPDDLYGRVTGGVNVAISNAVQPAAQRRHDARRRPRRRRQRLPRPADADVAISAVRGPASAGGRSLRPPPARRASAHGRHWAR